jgi:hypothetical protein
VVDGIHSGAFTMMALPLKRAKLTNAVYLYNNQSAFVMLGLRQRVSFSFHGVDFLAQRAGKTQTHEHLRKL